MTVVGAGVIGLSVAAELAVAGNAVTVVADATAEQSVSAVAAAVWFPYRAGAATSMATWLARSLVRFTELVSRCSPGTPGCGRAGRRCGWSGSPATRCR